MKKYTLTFILVAVSFFGSSYAQRINPHASFPAAADIRYELNTKGERLGIGVIFFLGNEAYLKGSVSLENTDVFRLFRGKKDFDIEEYRNTLTQFGYYHKVVNVNDIAFLNVGGSLAFGTEKILRTGAINETSNAYFSLSPGAEAEVYLIKNLALVGSFHYSLTLNSEVYKYDPLFGLGLRISLGGGKFDEQPAIE